MNEDSCFQSKEEERPYIIAFFGDRDRYRVTRIDVYNRGDCCGKHLLLLNFDNPATLMHFAHKFTSNQ